MSSKKIDPQKKYWWVIYGAVPIGVALVAAIPSLITVLKSYKPSPLPAGISITNNNFGSNMYFITQVNDTGDPTQVQAAQQAIQSATSLVQNNDYANAITQLEQAAAQYQLPSIYNNLGVLYANLGQYDKARDAYQKALKLDPNDQAANFNLGLLEQFQGNTSAANNLFSKAPDLKSTSGSGIRATADPNKPLAESISQIQGVTAELLEFTQFENTITAKVRFLNSVENDQTLGPPFRNAFLLDEATQKRYMYTTSSMDPNNQFTIPAKGNIYGWVKFDVPAADMPQYLSMILDNGVLFEHIPVP